MAPRPKPANLKLLLADVDGTLVTHDKVLTPRALAAVQALKGKNIAFAITSGRPPRGMSMVAHPLAVETPIAGFNGGVFTKPDGTVLETRTLPRAVAERAISALEAAGCDVWVYTADRWLIRDRDAPHVDRETFTVRFDPEVVSGFDDVLDAAVKVVGVSDDKDRMTRTDGDIAKALGETASAALSQPYYLDITHPQANKGAVVRYLAEHLGIDAGDIATIGDMPNDIRMFKVSGYAIAMGNGGADVQAAADVVTASNEDEGFAKALEQHLLA